MNPFRRRKDNLSSMSTENQLERLWLSLEALQDRVATQEARVAKLEDVLASSLALSFFKVEAAESEKDENV